MINVGSFESDVSPCNCGARTKQSKQSKIGKYYSYTQIILFAGGEMTPGELDWIDERSGDLLYTLRWDLFGRMTFLPKGIEPDDFFD